MKRLLLQRKWHEGERSIGEISYSGKHVAFTMEPGLDDHDAPRVPSGTYVMVPHGWEEDSGTRFKRTWALLGKGVAHHEGSEDYRPGFRTGILLHGGVRDEHTAGCCLVGTSIGISRDEVGLFGSSDAMELLREVIGHETALLEIRGA